ncbi:MAG: hypothetical protein MK135_17580, partial [Polyangiaceae bacterium]|nr:hypothetical protein [Polyangiaceae bacterium]
QEKLGDALGAARAWARILETEPDDEPTATLAIDGFLAAGDVQEATALLVKLLGEMLGSDARANYNERLAGIYEADENWGLAGAAYAESASGNNDPSLWAKARTAFLKADAIEQAAHSANAEKQLTEDPLARAAIAATEATLLGRLGDSDGALDAWREASELDPTNESYATQYEELLLAAKNYGVLVQAWLERAEHMDDAGERVSLRKKAANLQKQELGDDEGYRQAMLQVLDDGDDREALSGLAEDAIAQSDPIGATNYLTRLVPLLEGRDAANVQAHLGELLVECGDPAGALEALQSAAKLGTDRDIIGQLAALEKDHGDPEQAATYYEQLGERLEGEEKVNLLSTAAKLWRDAGNAERAIHALESVFSLDPEDFDALAQLRDYAKAQANWVAFAKYQRQLIEVEGDDEEAAEMTLELSKILHEQLKDSGQALEVLGALAATGHGACRDEYLRLGDEVGKSGECALQLVQWLKKAPPGPERGRGLLAAFERLVKAGKTAEAISVGTQLVVLKGTSQEVASTLEDLASQAKDLDALRAAYRLKGHDLTGPSRAEELVRQAEAFATAGLAVAEAVGHGEQSLSSAEPKEIEPLLARLAGLTPKREEKVGIYERQVAR